MPGKATKVSKKSAASGGLKKTHRFKPGTVALREIRKQQKATEFAFRKLPFIRLVREIAQDYKEDVRFSEQSLELMQSATEEHLIKILENANTIAIHAGRSTVQAKDITVARRIAMQACN